MTTHNTYNDIEEIKFDFTNYRDMQGILEKQNGNIQGVYIIQDNRTNEVFYVGYSDNVCYRLEQHVFGKDAENSCSPKVRERVNKIMNNQWWLKITVLKNLPIFYEAVITYNCDSKYNIKYGEYWDAEEFFKAWMEHIESGKGLYKRYIEYYRYLQ